MLNGATLSMNSNLELQIRYNKAGVLPKVIFVDPNDGDEALRYRPYHICHIDYIDDGAFRCSACRNIIRLNTNDTKYPYLLCPFCGASALTSTSSLETSDVH